MVIYIVLPRHSQIQIQETENVKVVTFEAEVVKIQSQIAEIKAHATESDKRIELMMSESDKRIEMMYKEADKREKMMYKESDDRAKTFGEFAEGLVGLIRRTEHQIANLSEQIEKAGNPKC